MVSTKKNFQLASPSQWVGLLFYIPWLDVLGEFWKYGRKLFRGLTDEGIYEVLEYESTLEILNGKGTNASFTKRKKIRYLQDNIIAYQDHAWGDGDILVNYKTSHGKPVDQYSYGYKTYILLSLREVKNKGDIDDFNIQWDIRQGFLTEDGYWGTDVNQRTKHIKVHVIFPKTRPPIQVSVEESNIRRTRILGKDAKKRLPDGRWQITWEKKKPKLFEMYVIRWLW